MEFGAALPADGSGTGLGPGDRSGQGGSSGSIRTHKSSSTIYGRVVTRYERPDHHIGHARPGHPNKILLRALSLGFIANLVSGIGHTVATHAPEDRNGSQRGHAIEHGEVFAESVDEEGQPCEGDDQMTWLQMILSRRHPHASVSRVQSDGDMTSA
ncbi:hypothetical protein ACWEP4_41690 [Streptomyces sp. NPDC004227]